MIVHLSIAVVIAGFGSYLSVFKPEYLSANLDGKPSGTWQWLASGFSLVFCIGTVLYLSPQGLLDWGYAIFILVFFFTALVDLHNKIIPNTLLIVLILVAIPKLYLQFELDLVLSALVLFIVFTLLNMLVQKFYSKQVFGWGDVKLIAVLSLYSGWDILWVIYIGIIMGGLIAGIGLLTKKITRETHIPMAVFLFIAFLVTPFIDLGRWF